MLPKNACKLLQLALCNQLTSWQVYSPVKISTRFAGSSHWHNIKSTKLAKDQAKSITFCAIIRKIRLAIHEGNGNTDPRINRALGDAFEMARRANMPKSTIEKTLKQLNEDYSNAKPFWMEFKNPRNGIAFIVLAYTCYRTKTRNETINIMRKHDLLRIDSGVRNLFNNIGVVIAEPPADTVLPDEKTLDDAIEVGAEEVTKVEDTANQYEFVCAAGDVNAIKTKLAAKNYSIISSEEIFLPRPAIGISEEEMESINKLYDKIEGIPEIVKVFDNIHRA